MIVVVEDYPPKWQVVRNPKDFLYFYSNQEYVNFRVAEYGIVLYLISSIIQIYDFWAVS